MSVAAEEAALRGPSAEAVAALSASKQEPAWMRHKRLAAWEVCRGLSMPLGTEEEWRLSHRPFDLYGNNGTPVMEYLRDVVPPSTDVFALDGPSTDGNGRIVTVLPPMRRPG